MSSARANRKDDFAEHLTALSDSDDDLPLTLNELDPQTSRSVGRPSDRFGQNGWGLGAPGSRIQMRRLQGNDYGKSRVPNQDSSHRISDELGSSFTDDGEGRTDSGMAEDDAPLLSGSQAATQREKASSGAPRSPSGGLQQLVAKLKSTPQSQQDEQYDPTTTRSVNVGGQQSARFPPNVVSNAKYTPWSFLPRTLYNEFSFFFNMYFLLVALSQIIPPLRIGYLSTYVAPLAFVLSITLGKEAFDDITRRRRDAEANSEKYTAMAFDRPSSALKNIKGKKRSRADRADHNEDEEAILEADGRKDGRVWETVKMSKDIRVGDVLKLSKGQRVPADSVILKSYLADTSSQEDSKDAGEAFIRTDQLDGETDWKLRLAPNLSQQLNTYDLSMLQIHASKPDKNVNEFIGNLTLRNPDDGDSKSVPLNIDNTAWANTVLASNASVLAVVVYTGSQTRQSMSTTASRTKTGLLEWEINSLTKILCGLTLFLSVILVILEKAETNDKRKWYIAIMRYLILFSTIVPISLRVNLDMGKSVYAYFIQHDRDMPDTVVRTSTIPEDLGRIEYLLSDKTGTLTQNGT